MRPNTVIFCLMLLTSHRWILAAEGVVIPLPKDGAWARYHVVTTQVGDSEQSQNSTGNHSVRRDGAVQWTTSNWLARLDDMMSINRVC